MTLFCLHIQSSKSRHVFGGFTSISWQTVDFESMHDNFSFMFSLINKHNVPLKLKLSQGRKGVIYQYGNSWMNYGQRDLEIVDDCDKKIKSSSSASSGSIYEVDRHSNKYITDNIVYDSKFLAGSQKFLIDEIEVFAVNIPPKRLSSLSSKSFASLPKSNNLYSLFAVKRLIKCCSCGCC